MSTSRLFSVFVVLALVVMAILTVRAGIATSEVVLSGQGLSDYIQRRQDAGVTAGADLPDRLQQQPGSASPADPAASDWVERHAASLKVGNAAPDWVERHAASLKAGNTAICDCFNRQPDSTIPADAAAPDWVERHAASLQQAMRRRTGSSGMPHP